MGKFQFLTTDNWQLTTVNCHLIANPVTHSPPHPLPFAAGKKSLPYQTCK